MAWALTGAVAATLTGCAIRHGEQPTSPWYTRAQVLTTAVLFAAVAWRFGPRTILFAPSWLAATGVALAAIDLRTRRLPNRLVLPSYLAIPSLAAVTTLSWGTIVTMVEPAARAAVATAFDIADAERLLIRTFQALGG